MTKENWIKWLQVRIPILKDKANEFWLAQALDGFHKDEQSRQAAVSGQVCRNFFPDGGSTAGNICKWCGKQSWQH